MSTITFDNYPLVQTIQKRLHPEDSHSIVTNKRVKRSIDVTFHWKEIHTIYETNPAKVFECPSKNDYLIINESKNDRSRYILSKTSYYWLRKSINSMQQHVEYGTVFDAACMGEIIEIERNLKALKLNIEKNGIEKTFFYRAEALLHFIRLCCTFFENPSEKFRRRLHTLFNVCASCWLHTLDIMLPMSIVRKERSFILDDDQEDFQNDSILRHYLNDDQKKIQKTNHDFPNFRHVLYSIVLLMDKLDDQLLIDRIYVTRLKAIYEIWILIDNEINAREKHPSVTCKKRTATTKKMTEKISWNFLDECKKYEKMFGAFTSNTH